MQNITRVVLCFFDISTMPFLNKYFKYLNTIVLVGGLDMINIMFLGYMDIINAWNANPHFDIFLSHPAPKNATSCHCVCLIFSWPCSNCLMYRPVKKNQPCVFIIRRHCVGRSKCINIFIGSSSWQPWLFTIAIYNNLPWHVACKTHLCRYMVTPSIS